MSCEGSEHRVILFRLHAYQKRKDYLCFNLKLLFSFIFFNILFTQERVIPF